MCGRYSITTPVEAMRALFRFVGPPPNLAPRYNAAPTQALPVVRRDGADDERSLAMLHWGLIPSWARDEKIASRLINARAETLADKPSFRSAFAKRRCLVPADGFYEWRNEKGRKQPYRIRRPDGSVFAFAGLWESWSGKPDPVETFTIVTTEAAPSIAAIHPRMPVILPEAAYRIWLDPTADRHRLQDLLRPYDGPLESYAVGSRVNTPATDDPSCFDPPTEEPGHQAGLFESS